MTLDWPPPGTPRVEVEVRHHDILRAEADALGCVVTPGLEPDDDASRELFSAAGDALRDDLRWGLTRRGRPGLEPGEALTVAVRREYPVGRVGPACPGSSKVDARGLAPRHPDELTLAGRGGMQSRRIPGTRHIEVPRDDVLMSRGPAGGERLPLRRLQLVTRDRDAALVLGLRRGVA